VAKSSGEPKVSLDKVPRTVKKKSSSERTKGSGKSSRGDCLGMPEKIVGYDKGSTSGSLDPSHSAGCFIQGDDSSRHCRGSSRTSVKPPGLSDEPWGQEPVNSRTPLFTSRARDLGCLELG